MATPDEGPGGPSLNPHEERLFGFGTDAWTERLRHAHASRGPLRLGPYEVLGELGRGGQGEVYRAVQPGTGRTVAIKRIAGLGFAPDPALLARFTREVEALTRLSHPNVVTVYTIDTVDHHAVLVMELVDGRHVDLWADAQWKAAPDPLNRVLEVFARACDGVAHAHQRGVIHRDIKPSNILVTGDDQPKVLDFGIARLLNEQAAEGARPTFAVTGFAGTPAYASPEQLTGAGGVDTRSDVYSLGVLLYRMLTGKEAFDPSLGMAARLKALEDGPIRLPPHGRGLPCECDWIVRKATDPDPNRRYSTIVSLAEDVRRVLERRPVLAHPPSIWYSARRAVQRRPLTWLSIGVATALIGVLGATTAVQAVRLSVRTRALSDALDRAKQEGERAAKGEKRQAQLNKRFMQAAMGMSPDSRLIDSSDRDAVKVLTELVDQFTPEDDQETVLEARMRLGLALRHERRWGPAAVQFAAAQAISDLVDEPWEERPTRIAQNHSLVLVYAGKHADALDVVNRMIDRQGIGARTIYVAGLYWDRMLRMFDLNRPDSELMDAAEDLLRRIDEHPNRVNERTRAREDAGRIARACRSWMRAERWTREAIDLATRHRSAHTLSRCNFNLGLTLALQGKWSAAEPYVRSAADFRVSSEGAHTSRGHSYSLLHARILQRMGSFRAAAARWELVQVRPMSWGKADHPSLPPCRVGLAAARFALGQDELAKALLALAVSKGATNDPADPKYSESVRRAESALRANQWQIDEGLERALADLKWIVTGLVIKIDEADQPQDDAPSEVP